NSEDPDCEGYDPTQTRGGALEDQHLNLFYSTRFSCNGNVKYDLWDDPQHLYDAHEVLFANVDLGMRPCNGFDIRRNAHGEPELDEYGNYIPDPVRFNPVVLSEIRLPNNQTYRFYYNQYGE